MLYEQGLINIVLTAQQCSSDNDSRHGTFRLKPPSELDHGGVDESSCERVGKETYRLNPTQPYYQDQRGGQWGGQVRARRQRVSQGRRILAEQVKTMGTMQTGRRIIACAAPEWLVAESKGGGTIETCGEQLQSKALGG